MQHKQRNMMMTDTNTRNTHGGTGRLARGWPDSDNVYTHTHQERAQAATKRSAVAGQPNAPVSRALMAIK